MGNIRIYLPGVVKVSNGGFLRHSDWSEQTDWSCKLEIVWQDGQEFGTLAVLLPSLFPQEGVYVLASNAEAFEKGRPFMVASGVWAAAAPAVAREFDSRTGEHIAHSSWLRDDPAQPE